MIEVSFALTLKFLKSLFEWILRVLIIAKIYQSSLVWCKLVLVSIISYLHHHSNLMRKLRSQNQIFDQSLGQHQCPNLPCFCLSIHNLWASNLKQWKNWKMLGRFLNQVRFQCQVFTSPLKVLLFSKQQSPHQLFLKGFYLKHLRRIFEWLISFDYRQIMCLLFKVYRINSHWFQSSPI